MAVIVDDRGAIHLAHLGEAALDPAELGETGADDLVADTHFHRHRHRRQRVLHIVAPGIGNSMSSIRGTSRRAGAARR
jgi:hypothetical protein